MQNDNDLLGEDVPPEESLPESKGANYVHAGVTVTWLCEAFPYDRRTIKKKLAIAGVQPIRMERGNIGIYNFSQACSALVKPIVDMRKYIEGMSPKDLPPLLQAVYWQAKLSRQKWEENAGDLWRTAKVSEVINEVFKRLKTTVKLWVDGLDRTTDLTASQRVALDVAADALFAELYAEMKELAEKKATTSQVIEAEQDDPVALAALEAATE